jgi:hypothetical protein
VIVWLVETWVDGWMGGWKLDESGEESFWVRKLGVVLHASGASSSHLLP